MESPGAYLHARRASGSELLRLASAAAAALLILSATGDVLIVVVLLGLAALDLLSFAMTSAAVIAVVLRWGSTSLAAIAGGQAVLGPALAVGSWAAAISSVAAAMALVCAAEPGPTAVPFGLAAALVVAGPSATSPGRLVVRVIAAVLGALLALIVARRVPAAHRRRLGIAAAVVAVAAALAA